VVTEIFNNFPHRFKPVSKDNTVYTTGFYRVSDVIVSLFF